MGAAALAAALGACASHAPAPSTRYALGATRAEYRDYTRPGQSICDAEPRWLSEELGGVNTLLSRFLEATAERPDGAEAQEAERTALLEEASRTLAPVVEVHGKNLKALQSCSFKGSGLFPAIAQKGNELVPQAQQRLADAPKLLAAAALQRVRERWVLEAPQREATARQTWCPPKPVVGTTDLFFARRSLDGRTEWLFCDGHIVEQLPGGEPALHAPEGLSRRAQRKVQPAKYLQAARNFPETEMDVPPTSVPKTAPSAPAASGASTP
ncbi:hypothetical protein FGE12_19910 [Aggregicoccus sp. 17bor-14]|nr:hypothetical protein [Simulacricoccus sp. 17bor-14]MRI90420.1 hypothetical protein [Aggregicoccus sp. 17bor-14]